MGAVEISIDEDWTLKVVQRYDLRYVNATSSSCLPCECVYGRSVTSASFNCVCRCFL